MIGEKSCTKCGVVKSCREFAPRRNVKSGLASWCRRCTSEHVNGTWAPKVRRDRKQQLIAHMGGKCMRCEGVYPHYVYDLHHRDPATKEINLSSLNDKRWARIIDEAAKCDLLCANCHRMAHHEGLAGKP